MNGRHGRHVGHPRTLGVITGILSLHRGETDRTFTGTPTCNIPIFLRDWKTCTDVTDTLGIKVDSILEEWQIRN